MDAFITQLSPFSTMHCVYACNPLLKFFVSSLSPFIFLVLFFPVFFLRQPSLQERLTEISAKVDALRKEGSGASPAEDENGSRAQLLRTVAELKEERRATRKAWASRLEHWAWLEIERRCARISRCKLAR